MTAPDTLARMFAEKGYAATVPPAGAQQADREAATNTPTTYPGSSAGAILAAMNRTPGPVPKGRLSRSMSDLTGGWFTGSEIEGNYNRVEAIREIRRMTLLDSDAAGAKRDIIGLANPGVQLVYTGSDRAKKQAATAIAQLLDRLGDYSTVDELVNNQIGEVYDSGASSLEWYPTPARSGVAGVEIVPAEEVRIQRDRNAREYVQNVYNVVLDPRTYIYSPYSTRGRDPYGTPMPVAALREIARKLALEQGTDKVIRLLGGGAFLNLEIPEPTLQQLNVRSINDPDYTDRRNQFFADYIGLATSAREKGVSAFPAGVKSEAIPLTGNVGGMGALQDSNNLALWSGLVTLPFMRGKMDSTTQALAQIVYPIQLSHSVNVRLPVTRSVEFGFNLHLQLSAIPCTVALEFAETPDPFVLDRARADQAQSLADGVYMEQLGPEYVAQVARRHGVDVEKVLAWRELNKPVAPPTTVKQALTTDSTGGNA